MTDRPEDVVLPCGCYLTYRMEGDKRVMQIAPCREDCPNLRNTLELASEGNVPVDRRRR